MFNAIDWHRPEYRDHVDQLISLTQVAVAAGVSRAAVSNWRRRHDFPAPAMTAGRTVWVVAAEVEQWLASRRPNRDTADTDAARIARLTDAVASLEERERKQANTLAATRKKLRKARAALAAAQA